MSFLAPLFFLGAAAVSLPILFHLVRRTTRERMPFSSLLFLSQTPPRVTRRNRIEDLLLLLLRCLALLLLAAGFSRPFLRNSALSDITQQPPERVLQLVDVSASMRRAGLWDAARGKVTALVRAAAPADEMSIWVYDHQARPLVTFAEWAATPAGDRAGLVASRLATVEPGWLGTHTDDALVTAAEVIAENTSGAKRGRQRVVLVTDLQEGARLDRLQAFDWPKGVELGVEAVKPKRPGNAGLQWVADLSDNAAATQAVVRVRVVNAPDATQGRFEVGWASPGTAAFLGRAEEVLVPPGQSRVVALPVPSAPPQGGVDRVLLRGDDEPFDNEVFVVPPVFAAVEALYLGADAGTEDPKQPLFFLRKALPATGRLSVRITSRPATGTVPPEVLKAARLYFVTTGLEAGMASALRTELEAGKTMVFAPASADAFRSLAPVLGLERLEVSDAVLKRYAMLATVDLQHPALASFADPRFSDFTKIHFWKHRRVELTGVEGARVMARFDSGDPAWVEIPVGKGRVFAFASGWTPDDSQFGLSTKFVPFLCAVAESGGAGAEGGKPWTVGDALPLTSKAAGRSMRLPSGTAAPLAEGVTHFSEARAPGIYTLQGGGEAVRYAVNLEGAEVRTAPAGMESLESLGAPVRVEAPAVKSDPVKQEQLAAVETESRQKLWRWLLVATLAVLLLESAIAAWRGRRMLQEREVVP